MTRAELTRCIFDTYGVEPDLIFGKLGDMNPYL